MTSTTNGTVVMGTVRGVFQMISTHATEAAAQEAAAGCRANAKREDEDMWDMIQFTNSAADARVSSMTDWWGWMGVRPTA